MEEDRNTAEEYSLFPEHMIPPEYTPEYPDVSYFQESYVTAREENIFRGETPPGEEDLRALRREERKKRARFSWLRRLLGSALRGGAVVFGMCALIVTLVSGADLPENSPWTPVGSMVSDLKNEPLHTPEDYGPEELLLLWRGDPEGPHQYDFEHAHLRREASCREDGIIEYLCTECGIALSETVPGAHDPAAAVREDERAAGCTEDGGCDEVVYCSICHEEMSRTHTVHEATGHTSAEPVMENIKGALCTDGGSYDTVVYCSVCHTELSRETVTTDAMGHTASEAVKENEISPSCTESGSYDSVVYCAVCHEEISRERVTVDALGHHPGYAGKENEKESSCTEAGSYDSVVYCMICGGELSREKVSLPLAAHIETQDIEENRVDPDCVTEGSADITVFCDICGKELRRETVVLEALGHTEDESIIENETDPTCTEEGGFDEVVYCMVCGEEISREHTVIEALGHIEDDPKEENRTEASCAAEGGYDTVIYCSVCGEELSRTHSTIAATGHNWGEPVYTWSSDNQTVTATRTCLNDSSHKETETVAAGSSVINPVTCTTAGKTKYTAAFSNSAFKTQSKEVTLPASGHNYGSWTTVTAATCTTAGSEARVCSRCSNKETRTVAALGHDWGTPTYTWADSSLQVTASRTCRRDSSHKESETATAVYSEGSSTMASCTRAGKLVYIASFQNSAFSNQTKAENVARQLHSFAMNWDEDSPVYCVYGCGTPAITLSGTVKYVYAEPDEYYAYFFTYTINSDFLQLLAESGCTEGQLYLREFNDASSNGSSISASYRNWSGTASGTITFETGEIAPSSKQIAIVFEYWNDYNEYCALSPKINIPE